MFESIKFLFWTFGRGARWGAWSIWRWDHTSWAGYVSSSLISLDPTSRLPRFESVHGLNLGLYLSRNFVALASCTSAIMFAFHFAFNAEWMLSLCPMHFPWWAAKFAWLPYLSLSKCLLRHTCLILSHLFCQEPFSSLQKLLLGTAHSSLQIEVTWSSTQYQSFRPKQACTISGCWYWLACLALEKARWQHAWPRKAMMWSIKMSLEIAALFCRWPCFDFLWIALSSMHNTRAWWSWCNVLFKCVRFHLYTCVKCLHACQLEQKPSE